MEDHLRYWRFAVFVGGFFLVFITESFFRLRTQSSIRGKRLGFHSLLSLFNTAVFNLFMSAPLLFCLIWVNSNDIGLSNYLGVSGIVEIILTVVFYDFIDYFWHRYNHTNNFLWRFHQVHHMDVELDVTTVLRFHVGELLLSGLVKISWIVLWGPSVLGFVLSQILISTFAQFHHGNIRIPKTIEKYLRKFIMTPSLHTGHHSVLRSVRSTNYSTIFIIWDKLFLTYHDPKPEEVEDLGLAHNREDYLSFKTIITRPFKS
jgi:sterol desaturase/sphingolipid hydroxylase (fatty acid hydroxylase superfamily)